MKLTTIFLATTLSIGSSQVHAQHRINNTRSNINTTLDMQTSSTNSVIRANTINERSSDYNKLIPLICSNDDLRLFLKWVWSSIELKDSSRGGIEIINNKNPSCKLFEEWNRIIMVWNSPVHSLSDLLEIFNLFAESDRVVFVDYYDRDWLQQFTKLGQ